MAARLRCELDAARDVVLLRPFGAESRGRTIARARDRLGSSAVAVPPDHRQDVAVRRLPACAYTSAGPCCLRFTCADLRRHMETTVMNFVTWHDARQRGQRARTFIDWDWHFQQLLMNQWEELGQGERLNTYVLGGCRHKFR
uniref:Protein X n=1 Tax=Bat Hepatitis B virus TaxID=1401315 RepID=A0A2H5BVJ9_HBV|nr:X protein [Bat Hepatitis B virus]AUG90872.1 X protein [Bat Hepatitis B virus]AUG90881.1 X protein [Bat Hepatitis B virus]